MGSQTRATPDTQHTLYVQLFWHEWPSDRRYGALDWCTWSGISISIDLEGSRGRFIGLKGGLKGSKGPKSKNYNFYDFLDFFKISTGFVNNLSGAARSPGGCSRK